MDIEQLKNDIARRLGLEAPAIYGRGLTLGKVLELSPQAVNSIDILEAFIGALGDQGVSEDVGLPALTRDDPFDDVVEMLSNSKVEP